MNISLITPAPEHSRSGNRATADRWASLLRELGHEVDVGLRWEPGAGPAADLLVAVHAYRSAPSVAAFRARHPRRPVVVLLAGTDIYRFQITHAATTVSCMQQAHRLVGLHDDVAADIPAHLADRVRVIHQSAQGFTGVRTPPGMSDQICVVGHLREEKDPLRAALAVRRLPARSRLHVLHIGRAHDRRWALRARAEAATNPRYRWLGEVSRTGVRRTMRRSRLMVLSSVMEGGANVVSEAIVADLPVIGSDVPGNRGLLGAMHPGLFPAGDAAALAALLRRTETQPAFLSALVRSGRQRRYLFTPEREREQWRVLIAGL
jgi:putative glycosyltransferase (TIGR04348 family)